MTEITQAFWAKKSLNPKTVLGFYATVLGIGLAACTSIIAVLAATGTAVWLIPWIAVFAGGFIVLLVAGVFVINFIDTSKLMLSPVSGTEYQAIRQGVVLGDSMTGQRLLLTDQASPESIDATVVDESTVVSEEEARD